MPTRAWSALSSSGDRAAHARAQGRVDRFDAFEQSGQISDVSVFYPGAKLAPASTRARRLALERKIDPRPLDAWYATEKTRPADDQEDVLATTLKPTGPGGLVPSIENLYSFDDANPNLIKLQFSWG